tara:strand:- start:3733 stop:4671 length:939 start_codon:yes stop_codon:yes gene_type:complete
MIMFRHREFRFSLASLIDALHLQERGRLPELKDPPTYSDKIQWLKLHDQMIEQIICCDKLLARTFVSQTIGKEFLLDLHHVSTRLDDPRFSEIEKPFMLKTNHDSGSVYRIETSHDLHRSLQSVAPRIQKPYGILTGEWAYYHIMPLVFAETMMAEPVVEYRFHCSDRAVKWVEIVEERITGLPKVFFTNEAGRMLPLRLDGNVLHPGGQPELPVNWQQMSEVARELSDGFRYVRIDLSKSEGRTYFGEMTFWPTAGFSSVKHDADFGDMLDIDLSFKRPSIHSEYRIAKNSRSYREIRRSELYQSLRPLGK